MQRGADHVGRRVLDAHVPVAGALLARDVGVADVSDELLDAAPDPGAGAVGVGQHQQAAVRVPAAQARDDVVAERVAARRQDLGLDGAEHRRDVVDALDDDDLADQSTIS